ncbi:hypothetical protein IPH70_04225 [Candidatus Roizmanbacteria bacterium]|nr:MAG: hypothetical protein IPH70_04225 [Candidatus Roizmanbacteria bacterium]
MDDWLSDLRRVVRLITLIFFIFTGIFLLVNSFNTAYKIYTQKLPTIHNAGPAATFIDEVLDQGDYYFIGPYEPNESFYVKRVYGLENIHHYCLSLEKGTSYETHT